MKLKIVIVDLEMSPAAKKRIIRYGIPLAVILGGGALAWAGSPWTLPQPSFPQNGPLTASDLNNNFNALADAGATLQAQVTQLQTGLSAANVSEIQVYDTFGPHAVAFGTTNTAIFRFKSVLTNTGTDITYTPSAVNGDSFTINQSGLYAIQWMSISPAAGAGGGATGIGLSVNALSSEDSTTIDDIDVTHRLNMVYMAIPSNDRAFPTVGGTYRLNAGDVVRAHGNPGDFCEDNTTSYPNVAFRIVKVAPLF